jgi:hypothetical protein
LPARQLVLDHADRESIAETTAWRDWEAVSRWNEEDFNQERATLLSRLQNMRIRAIHAAMKKGQYQSAASMMDSLGKFLGEGEPEVNISAPNLSIRIEQNAPEENK